MSGAIYTRGEVAELIGAHGHNVGHYARRIRVLRHARRGTGNWQRYTLEGSAPKRIAVTVTRGSGSVRSRRGVRGRGSW